MTDQELIQTIGQVVDTKIEPMKKDIQSLKDEMQEFRANFKRMEAQINGVRVYLDTDMQRTLNLLLEGQMALLDRVVPPEKYEALEVRASALEMAVRQHSQEIQELKLA